MALTRQINYWVMGGFEGKKPVLQAIEEAKAMGYEGLEPAFGAGELTPDTTEAEAKRIADGAKKLGLPIRTVCTGAYWGMSLSHPDAAVRKKAVEFTTSYLQVAGWLGAKVALVVPGHVAVPFDPSQPVVPYKQAWKLAAQSLKQVLPMAHECGVKIGLENVWNWFLADPIAMKMFIDEIADSHLGCYFDIGNVLINGYPEHWIEVLGKSVFAVHYKNFSRDDCGGNLHGFGDDLLKGDVNFEAVAGALKAIKYKGTITAEMIPFCRLPDLVLPDMALAKDTAPKLLGITAGI